MLYPDAVRDLFPSPVAVTVLAIAAVLVVVLAITLTVVRAARRPTMVNAGIRAVLITGCDRGFGYMAAKRLDTMGYKVFAGCLDAGGEGAKQLEKETSKRLHLLQLDVTKDEQVAAARLEVTECLMGNVLWAIVNNAGVAHHADFEWFPVSNFRYLMDVNFMGVVRVTRAFLPLIRATKGRIVNVASMAGRTAMPGFTAYSASKSAVIGFSESLRREMVHFDVKVILMEPALFKTRLSCPEVILPQNQRFWEQAEPGIKRDYGETFFKATQKSQEKMMGWADPKVDKVVDCIAHAVSSSRPLSRYVAPLYLHVLNDAMNMALTGLQDWVVRRFLGVDAQPAIADPLHNAANGRQGRRRSHAT